jgi:hypothetical protein
MATRVKQRPNRRSLADQLRQLVLDRGLSGYGLAKSAGLAPSVVNRFLAGDGLTLASLDQLVEVLGLRLVEAGRRAAPSRRRANRLTEHDNAPDPAAPYASAPTGIVIGPGAATVEITGPFETVCPARFPARLRTNPVDE